MFDVYPPFTAILTVHFPGTDLLHIMNAASPVSARRTRLFVPLLRNFDTSGDVEAVHAFNAQIFAEDQAIVDRAAVGYRRMLRTMGLSLQQAA